MKLRKFFKKSLFIWISTTAFLASALTLVTAPNAHSATSCRNTSDSYYEASNLRIQPVHGKVFYTDLRRGIDAAYVGYKVSNLSGTRSNLWVKVSSFSSTGASVLSLVNAADGSQQIASMVAPTGSGNNTVYDSETLFYLLKASATSTAAQVHNVAIYQGRPDIDGSTLIIQCDYQFTKVVSTIAANSNKVTSMSVSSNSPTVGGTLVVTVNGLTGQGGAGDTSVGADGDIMWISPASNSRWPTRSLKLENTKIDMYLQGQNLSSTSNDTLILEDIGTGNTKFGSKTRYVATYTFKVLGGAATNPIVKPVAQIASGTQMKYTGSYPAVDTTIALTSSTVPLTISKSASSTIYGGSNSCNTVASTAAIRYTITGRVPASFSGSVSLDELVDVPATGVTYDPLANQASVTDATSTRTQARSLISGESPVRWHFVGPFSITADKPVSLSYTACVPTNSSQYANKAYGFIGGTIVGSSNSTVTQVTVSTDGTSVTTTDSQVAKDKLTQTITFDALPDVGINAVTNLVATSSAGLPVTFSTLTATKCRVDNNAGVWQVTALETTSVGNLCTVRATAAGNDDYNSATADQNQVIKTGQYISLTATSSMPGSSSAQTQTLDAFSYVAPATTTLTGLLVTMTSLTTDICTVALTSGRTFTVTVLANKSGNCVLEATQAGDATYPAATPVERTIFIGSQQEIVFSDPVDHYSDTKSTESTTIAYQDVTARSVNVSTQANTGLTVTIESASSVCTVGTPAVSGGVTTVRVTKVSGVSGTCILVASQAGDATYGPAADVTKSFNIGVPQFITFPTPSNTPLSSSKKAFAATSFLSDLSTNTGLTLTYTLSGTTVCHFGTSGSRTTTSTSASGSSLEVNLATGGACVITASQSGDGRYWPADPVTSSFTVTGATAQSITFTQDNSNINSSPLVLNGESSSGLPVSYTSATPSICTISGILATLLTVGECSISADQSGDATYAAAQTVTRTFTVFAKPTIAFTQPANVAIESSPISLSYTHTYAAAAGSTNTGLTVSFTSNDLAVCTVSGTTVTLLSNTAPNNVCSITASQAGNGTTFLASDSVTRTFSIIPGQEITFNSPGNKTYGISPFTVEATTTSNLQITFTSSTQLICTVADPVFPGAGNKTSITVTALRAGDCTLLANQAGNNDFAAAAQKSVTFEISKKTVTITASSHVVEYGDAVPTISATFSSDFVAPDSSSVLTTQPTCSTDYLVTTPALTNGSATVVKTECSGAAADNYTFTYSDGTISVAKKPITVTAQNISVNAGQALGAITYSVSVAQLRNGDNSDPFSGITCSSPNYTTNDSAGTSGRTTVCSGGTASNYEPNHVSGTVTITDASKQSQQISFNAIENRTYGAANFSANADHTVGAKNDGWSLELTSLTTDICTIANGEITIVKAGDCSIRARTTNPNAGNSNFNPAEDVTRTFTINKRNQVLSATVPASLRIGAADITIEKSSNVAGLTPTMAVASGSTGVCAIVAGKVRGLTTGVCTLEFDQNGDDNTNAATRLQKTLNILAGLAASTNSPSAVSKESATLNGESTESLDNPKFCLLSSGAANTPFANKQACVNGGGSLKTAVPSGSNYSADLSSLPPSTWHHFVLFGEKDGSNYEGTVISFKTKPSVVTNPGSLVTARSARFNATVSETLTNPRFCYNTRPVTTLIDCLTDGLTTVASADGDALVMSRKSQLKKESTRGINYLLAPREKSRSESLVSYVTYTAPVAGLDPNTTYYFIIYGTVDGENYDGGVKSFATPANDDSGGGGGTTQVVIPGPRIDAISRNLSCSTGAELTITGAYFTDGRITLEGLGVIVRNISDNSIQVLLPESSAGRKTVTITTPHGVANFFIEYVSVPKPVFETIRIPYLSQGSSVSLPFTATNASLYGVVGRLPSGLTQNASTGLISGTPSENGIYVITLTATGICGETRQIVELDIDAPTPNAISHRINFLPGSCVIPDSAKASLEAFLEKAKGISPRNIIPEIYVSGGGKANDPNSLLADCRQEAICDFLLLENLLGEVLSDVFTGSENRVEIIVYWPRPNDDF